MDKIKTDINTLRKFGLTMFVCFILISLAILFRRGSLSIPFLVISLFFLLTAVAIPGLLKYLYILWMKFAFVLGWINTRLLLCVIFYFFFLPAGLIMRLFKVDPLDRKFNQSILSYWKSKENKKFSAVDYERQS